MPPALDERTSSDTKFFVLLLFLTSPIFALISLDIKFLPLPSHYLLCLGSPVTQFLLSSGLRLYSSPYQPVYQSQHPMIPPLFLSPSPSANRGCPSTALISVCLHITTSVLSSLGPFVSLSMLLHVCLSVSVTLSASVFVRLCQVSNHLPLAISLCLSDSAFFSLPLFLSVILSLTVSVYL